MTLVARTTSRVWGSHDAWSLAPDGGSDAAGRDCAVDLEIRGDDASGYHLVMSPAGFFTADTWHETLDDAYAAAAEFFGIAPERWAEKRPG